MSDRKKRYTTCRAIVLTTDNSIAEKLFTRLDGRNYTLRQMERWIIKGPDIKYVMAVFGVSTEKLDFSGLAPALVQ